jgi:hypothetical protein
MRVRRLIVLKGYPQGNTNMAPRKPEAERRSEILQVPATPAMRRAVEERAKQRGVPLAVLGREAFDLLLSQGTENGEGKP